MSHRFSKDELQRASPFTLQMHELRKSLRHFNSYLQNLEHNFVGRGASEHVGRIAGKAVSQAEELLQHAKDLARKADLGGRASDG